jgi:hypothetical protein
VLVADSREAAQGMQFASCRQPHELMPPLGERLKATQDGGRSQPEERHNLAAEVRSIIRRRKNPVRGAFGKYSRTQHLLWRGDSIHVSDPPLPESVPGYRHASSGGVH